MAQNLEAEHARLKAEVEALVREHRALQERRPFDRQAHHEHARRLQEKNVELQAHAERLRAAKP